MMRGTNWHKLANESEIHRISSFVLAKFSHPREMIRKDQSTKNKKLNVLYTYLNSATDLPRDIPKQDAS